MFFQLKSDNIYISKTSHELKMFKNTVLKILAQTISVTQEQMMKMAWNMLHYLHHLHRLVPVCLHLSCTGELKTGPSIPNVSPQGWGEVNNHHLCPAGNALPNVLQGAVRSSLLQRCIVGSCSIYCSLGTQNCCLPFWSVLHQFDNGDIMRECVKSLAENKTNSSRCSPLINKDSLPWWN